MVFVTLRISSAKVALNGMESMAGYVMGENNKDKSGSCYMRPPLGLPTNQYEWGLHNCKKPE